VKLQRILVLDDEGVVRSVTADILREEGYSVLAVSTSRQAITALTDEEFDLVLSDIRLEAESGLQFLAEVRKTWPELPLMIMTGFGSLDSALEAIRLRVFEYLLKPIDPRHLVDSVHRLEESLTLKAENRYLRSQSGNGTDEKDFLGCCVAMEKLRGDIRKISQTDATVLIRGESGTGKEVAARALHQSGRRADKPFIRVNCAAIPANLLESEFFGHEKGAFTGATSRRQGRFELADQGTLLLDEISEIPPDLQVKLLRVLQEREFERVGGNQTIQVDVNIIATTNRQLEEEVRAGRFREDLFYRLNVVPLQLPPLRDRGRDVIELASQFAKSFARKHGKPFQPLNGEIEAHLLSYRWPGNVRELQNAVERAVILADNDGVLRPEDIVDFGQGLEETEEETADIRPLAELEKRAIIRALDRCEGNRTHAAKLLGISLRTLRNKINRYREDGMDL